MESQKIKGMLNWLIVGLLALVFAFGAQPVAAQETLNKEESSEQSSISKKALKQLKKGKKPRPSMCPSRKLPPKKEVLDGEQGGDEGAADGEDQAAKPAADDEALTDDEAVESEEGAEAQTKCRRNKAVRNFFPQEEEGSGEQASAIDEFSDEVPGIGESGPVDVEG